MPRQKLQQQQQLVHGRLHGVCGGTTVGTTGTAIESGIDTATTVVDVEATATTVGAERPVVQW